ncbi:MAG TPA: type III-A CRISPR-associated protein Cas10/Csm1 [Anaerohalosphaeraceae bacterium]|nr:type III-A CRISPR-associated protein Cas10/Csm1 [Anaerohalosphaeraceae bacterium]HPC65331.1 type III-A CRISPR-associated protein Cas10/Csm1 [Anaerohalosphaeraceae bacterium]HPO70763.1 type III-A CRISPR-associated protein Cas10/Csm1 [Anaerohalosphaeraceae bacterium]HRV21142.1 type III-A CRISPR-associated protein Cas10/Csm1 [Anaerohalosphaeraceae bacterium]
MDKTVAEVSIGAFLHDVGKISHRAKVILSKQSERMKQQVCPTKAGYSTHLHAAYTSDFFEQVLLQMPSGVDKAAVTRLASYHHRPSDELEQIIQQADWLSAGQDRGNTEEGRNLRLRSIFASLLDTEEHSQAVRYRLTPQTLDMESFPQDIAEDTAGSEYAALFGQFSRAMQTQMNEHIDLYIEQLRWLGKVYFWSVPSSQLHASDISLLDHSLTTACIAAALYQYHAHTNTLEERAICAQNEKKFRLVTGDLSGIQNYLFHDMLQDQKGASKRLRARSFYLGLLTDYTSRYLLRHLGLSVFNILLDAGGQFTLMVANTDQNLQILDKLQANLGEWFYRQYQGLLNLNLSYETQLAANDLKQENIESLIQQNAASVEQKKKRSFAACLTCGDGWQADRFLHAVDVLKQQEEEKTFFEELGGKLPKAVCTLLGSQGAVPEGILGSEFEKASFAWPFDYSGINLSDTLPRRRQNLLSYSELIPGQAAKPLSEVSNGQYLATYVPRDRNGQILSFEQLAAMSKGYPMLGVLKADVDRLGLIFSRGLGKNNSLGRLAMLSRQVDFFFRGFLPSQLVSPPQGHEEFKNIYCVYTGGDDLLLVGPWSTVLEFALFLNNAFRRYTCNNPKVTLSAAVAVIHPNMPLARAAMQADQMLEEAKDAGRNRMAVFNEVMTWDEYAKALDDGLFLHKALTDKGTDGIKINRGFVYRLLNYYKMASDETKVKNLIWRSHLAYDIARNVEQPGVRDSQIDTPGRRRIKEMTRFGIGRKDEIKRLKVSATYCLYLNRKGDKNGACI